MTHDPSDFRTPGQYVEALLKERGWTKRTLAIVVGLDETNVSRIVSDKQPVSAAVALALEEAFGAPAEDFLKLQQSYDLAKARISQRPDPARKTRAHLFGGLPVAEMIKRRWIEAESLKDVAAVEASMSKFFGVDAPDQIEIMPHAAKKTVVGGEVSPAQLVWLYRVKSIASEMMVAPYSKRAAQDALTKLSSLRKNAEDVRKVPRLLAECGIRFVIVETIGAAKIDGVCLWLDDHSPVIALSLRHDRIDNFWFVLRHEIEHVLQGHGLLAPVLDADLEGAKAGTGPDVPEEERIANAAAAEFCVSQKMISAFVARKAPFFSERDLLGFAQTLSVHPGLVAGQLQHRTGRYDRFRNHLAKIRHHIAPSSTVDGWGDVAPIDF
jgi:HTH-type transcriptional regulator/antitoxin HigA